MSIAFFIFYYFLKKNLIMDDKNLGSLIATIFIFPSYLSKYSIRYQPKNINPPPTANIHPTTGITIANIIPIPIEATIIPKEFFILNLDNRYPPKSMFCYII